MRSRQVIGACALLALATGAGACGSSDDGGTKGAAAPQRATVVARTHAFAVQGAGTLRPGLVTFTVKDASRVTHGAGFVRLDPGTSGAQAAKLLAGDQLPAKLPFTLLGGVPELQPGQSWQATMRLGAGDYAIFDDGENGKGMLSSFHVAGGPAAQAAAPKTVGSVTMRDFRFGFHLPRGWDGKGVLHVANTGRQLHELTFIRMPSAAAERKLKAELSKGYPSGPPPKGITYALGGTSAGQSADVKLDLTPGRYLAVCLFPDPKTGKPHTALGMLSSITVPTR